MSAKKLLYVEDLFQKEIETDPYFTILSNAGLEVTIAKNGEEAYEKLFNEKYDCLILDIMLPHKGQNIPINTPSYRTGIHLLEMVKKGSFKRNQGIRVIIVSAIVDLVDVEKIKSEYSIDHYLEKPFKPPLLLEVVRRVLEKNNQ